MGRKAVISEGRMMQKMWIVVAVALGSGCASNGEYVEKLRDALAKADVGLTEAIVLAEQDQRAAFSARLLVNDAPVFSVRAAAQTDARKYAIDLQGTIVSEQAVADSGAPCGSISLQQAVAVAEAEVNGEGVSIELDDDGVCAYEVQVLTSSDLMEVEVSGSGQVLEVEVSDEEEGDDD